jgi:outer membrane lipoprotein SlyB
VVGVFRDRAQAEKAIDELHHAGFAEDQVGFLTRSGEIQEARTATTVEETRAADGAMAGAVVGGAVGTAVGALVLSLVPGIGLAVTGGMFTVLLAGLSAGAAGGALVGTFVGMGLSEEEARHYEQEFKAGRTIIVVHAGDRSEEARAILRRNGAQSEGPPAQALPSRGTP